MQNKELGMLKVCWLERPYVTAGTVAWKEPTNVGIGVQVYYGEVDHIGGWHA